MTETTTIFTFAQFMMIAIFAVLVIFGILFGMRLKRRRIEAEAEVEANREALGEHAEPPAVSTLAVPAVRPVPVTKVPVAADSQPAASVAESIAPPPPAESTPATLAGDITQLKGLGPKLAATLAGLGITRVDQVAAMSPAQLADLDAQLGSFKGRPARDRWAEQAKLLVAGDKAAYEAEFGKLG